MVVHFESSVPGNRGSFCRRKNESRGSLTSSWKLGDQATLVSNKSGEFSVSTACLAFSFWACVTASLHEALDWCWMHAEPSATFRIQQL